MLQVTWDGVDSAGLGFEANRGERSGGRTRESVHLCDYPRPDETQMNATLSAQMQLAREICSKGRAARMEHPLAPNSIRYRMLAEFLEKGVIRKSRFWTTRWSDEPSESRLLDTYRVLMNEPLPLTP